MPDISVEERNANVYLTTTQLKAYTGPSTVLVVEDGVYSGTYISTNESLINDEALIFPKSGGGHWVRQVESTIVQARWYLKSDYETLSGLTVSGTTVTSAAPAFTIADIGKNICIYGAGGAGVTLGDEHETMIVGFVSSTNVTIEVAASTNGSAYSGFKATNNSLALQEVLNSLSSDFEFHFESDQHYYFYENPANTDNAPIRINNKSNIKFQGNNATLYWRGSVPNSYASEPASTIRNLFIIHTCDNISFSRFIFKNCSQTFARGVRAGSTTNEGGYYTVAGGIAVTYDRRWNKKANSGSAVYNVGSDLVSIFDSFSYDVGCFYRTSGEPEDVDGGTIARNYIYGYCITAIFPCSNCVVTGNIIDNEPAPVLDYNDFDAERGTSHAIYTTGGYAGVLIENNVIRNCRGWAVQFNTSSGNNTLGSIVSRNTFHNCFATGAIFGNEPFKQLSWIDNVQDKCGYLLIDHPNLSLSLSGNKWTGVFDLLPSGSNEFSMEAFQISRVHEFVCSDEFVDKNSVDFSNSGAISISNTVDIGNVIFNNCIVDDTCKFFITAATPLDLIEGLTVKNCKIKAGSYLNFAADALAANPRYNIVYDNNDMSNVAASSQLFYQNFGIIISNNIIRCVNPSAVALYFESFVTNAKDLFMKGNTFINEGSDLGFRATAAGTNNRVIFIDNVLLGSVEIRLDTNTFKFSSRTYNSVSNTIT